MHLLKRFKESGLNLLVLGVSVAVFLGAFCALTGLAGARTPPTITILAAGRNIDIGEPITAAVLVEKTVYEDENSLLYIPVEQAADVIGGLAALPIRAGQPVLRDAIVAPAGNGFRLSAVLSEYPNHSLFPLPIDASNVIAPGVEAFLPGDLVGVTVVIDRRPQPPATPEAGATGLGTTPQVISSTLPLGQVNEGESEETLDQTGPPLAKDLFPQGVRVVMVEGKVEPVQPDADNPNASPVFNPGPAAETLILLIPNETREELALAMQQGAQIFISLLAHVEADEITPGFTYWDFEDLFVADRAKVLGGEAAEPTPVGTPQGNR